MILILVISISLNLAFGYASWNLLRKNEVMEDAIDIFYTYEDCSTSLAGITAVSSLTWDSQTSLNVTYTDGTNATLTIPEAFE